MVHGKKPPGHFLSGPDFGKNAVDARLQVDLERLLVDLLIESDGHGI